ncbi:MAG: hypothetical protein ACK4NX_03390, partial [Candidatus Paceibacteria bacterium]
MGKNPLLRQTLQDFQNKLTQLSRALTEQYKALNPVPENPIPRPETIVDNQEQLNKITKTPLAVYEDAMKKWDIPKRIREIEDMRARIVSENEAYDTMIKEIRETGGVPQSVLEKRINRIEQARNINLRALQAKYDFLLENYNNALQQAKMELGLYESEQEAEQKRLEQHRDNTRQIIQQMISTGALGEVDDQELRKLAVDSGYTFEGLKAVRKAVKSGNETKIRKEQLNLQRIAEQMDIARQRLELAQERSRNTQEIKAENFDEAKQEAAILFEADRQ